MAAPPILSGRSIPYRIKNNEFSPRQIANLKLWLDSSDIYVNDIRAVEGQKLTSWNDKAGVGITAIAEVDGEPTYQDGGVYFSSGKGFTITGIADALSPETIFMVVNYSGSTTAGQTLLYPETSGGRLLTIKNDTLVSQPLGSDINLSYGTTSTSNINLVCSLKDNSNLLHYIDGLNVATTALASYTGSGFITYLGTDNYVGTTPLTGSIYEVLWYGSNLTTVERQNVESYLAWKWNLKATPFSPNQLSGLNLWLDSGDLAQDDTNVNTWPDKSPSARSITGGTPKPITTVSGVSFSAGSGFNTDYAPKSSLNNETLFIVLQYSGSTTSGQYILYSTDVNDRRISILNDKLTVTGRSGGPLNTGTTTPNSLILITIRNTVSSDTFEYFINGTSAGSVTSLAYDGLANMQIGTSNYNATNGLNGFISEIVMYNTSLSDTNRSIVEKYLGKKWNINPVLSSVLPTSIANLQLWLDSTDVNGNGTREKVNPLTTWTNKSSSGLTITQSITSNKPTYSNNSIVFNGQTGYTTTYNPVITETVFAVLSYTNSINPMNILFPTISGNRRLSIESSELNTITGTGGLSNGNISISNITLITTLNNNTNIFHYINGNSNSGGTSGTTPNTGTTLIGIDTTSNVGFEGTINELIIYNTALSDTDRRNIELYLTNKWIPSPSNLPISHPYYYNNVSANTPYILSQIPRTLNGSNTFNSNNYPLISNRFSNPLRATFKSFT